MKTSINIKMKRTNREGMEKNSTSNGEIKKASVPISKRIFFSLKTAGSWQEAIYEVPMISLMSS